MRTTFSLVSVMVLTALSGQSAHVLESPPPVVTSAGGFTTVKIGHEPQINGREWVAADVRTTSSAEAQVVRTGSFSLTTTDCGDHGDFERCRLLFRRGSAAPVRIGDGFTAWVYVTPDGRYIFTEPLYALDVRAWKEYALFQALHIRNYVSIDAISRDGRRLLISRRDCAIDCGNQPREHYELTLPK